MKALVEVDGYPLTQVSHSFLVDIIDQCASAILTIDTSILTDTNLYYVIGSAAHIEQLSTGKVSSDVDLVVYTCPSIEFSFEN